MDFNQMVRQFEERVRLQYKYELKKVMNGETLVFPPGKYLYDEIEINNKTAGYLINRVDTVFEIFIFDKPFRKVHIWGVKRTGNTEDKTFDSIEDVLIWMNDSYIRDINRD
ncbi:MULTISPECIES: hypothetical protein [Bacillati]|uniref:hypothetical protein n=1 Tax=Bacillati TaxID=1783272 RepID=UPI0035DFB3EC